MNGRRAVGLVLLVAIVAVVLFFVLRIPARSRDLSAEVMSPGTVGHLSFNRLWGSIVEATGVESEGAMRSQTADGAAGGAPTTAGPSSTAAPPATNAVPPSSGWSSTTFTYFLVPVSEVR